MLPLLKVFVSLREAASTERVDHRRANSVATATATAIVSAILGKLVFVTASSPFLGK